MVLPETFHRGQLREFGLECDTRPVDEREIGRARLVAGIGERSQRQETQQPRGRQVSSEFHDLANAGKNSFIMRWL